MESQNICINTLDGLPIHQKKETCKDSLERTQNRNKRLIRQPYKVILPYPYLILLIIFVLNQQWNIELFS